MPKASASTVDVRPPGAGPMPTDGRPTTLEDHQAIADAVQVYLDAAQSGVPRRLREFMQDHARVVGQIDGTFMATEPDAFVEWVRSSGPSPSVLARIVSTDVSGSVARVRIEITDWLGFRFTDFFLLSKEAGAWRLSSKVFDAHARNYAAADVQIADEPLAEADAIAAVVQTYIDSARTGDAKRLRSIWFDHAHIVGSLDGAPVNRTADAFSEKVGQSGGAANVRGRVVSIDRSGPAASARIEFEDWNGVRYTDMFTLFKADGTWRVAGKVFDAHGRR